MRGEAATRREASALPARLIARRAIPHTGARGGLRGEPGAPHLPLYAACLCSQRRAGRRAGRLPGAPRSGRSARGRARRRPAGRRLARRPAGRRLARHEPLEARQHRSRAALMGWRVIMEGENAGCTDAGMQRGAAETRSHAARLLRHGAADLRAGRAGTPSIHEHALLAAPRPPHARSLRGTRAPLQGRPR